MRKDVTSWPLRDAEEECRRLDGEFERRGNRVFIVYGKERVPGERT